ncbi:hypothetical protein EJB05_31609, partial [Eragrostis curvula]
MACGPQVEAGGGAPKLRRVAACSEAGLLGLAAASTAITLAVSVPPPPGLDTNAYFLALSGVFFAGVTQVAASVWAADDGRRLATRGSSSSPFLDLAKQEAGASPGSLELKMASKGSVVEAGGGAPKIRQAPACFEAGLFGLLAISMAITLAVTLPTPPLPWLHTDAYFIALSGVFFAGVTQVATSVWAADDGRRRLATGRKLVYASLVVPLSACQWLRFSCEFVIARLRSIMPPAACRRPGVCRAF